MTTASRTPVWIFTSLVSSAPVSHCDVLYMNIHEPIATVRRRQAVATMAYKHASIMTASLRVATLPFKNAGVTTAWRLNGWQLNTESVYTPATAWYRRRWRMVAIFAGSNSNAKLWSCQHFYKIAKLHVANLSPRCRHACAWNNLYEQMSNGDLDVFGVHELKGAIEDGPTI